MALWIWRYRYGVMDAEAGFVALREYNNLSVNLQHFATNCHDTTLRTDAIVLLLEDVL
jgi:hypothetical protein